MTGAPAYPPLTLGTVQLGMDYGSITLLAKPSDEVAFSVMDAGWASGLAAFDTARNYGDAEARIGAWMAARGHRPRLVTKFPDLGPEDEAAVGRLRAHLERSLAALGVDRLEAWLAHKPGDLLRSAVVEALRACQAEGRIGCFGASVYTVEEAHAALELPDLGAIQLPLSLFDRRFIEAGIIETAARRGVAVFARSVFLQGMLLHPSETLTGNLLAAVPALDALTRHCLASGCTRVEAALDAVLCVPDVTSVVVGVVQPVQVEEIAAAAASRERRLDAIPKLMTLGPLFPTGLLDPRKWAP